MHAKCGVVSALMLAIQAVFPFNCQANFKRTFVMSPERNAVCVRFNQLVWSLTYCCKAQFRQALQAIHSCIPPLNRAEVVEVANWKRNRSKPLGSVPTIDANFRGGQTVVLHCHVMPLGPKRLFPIDLHGERDICNSV